MIARRRARTPIPWGAEVGAGLQCALRDLRCLRISGIEFKLCHVGGDVHNQPVPEAAAGGSVRIKTGNRKALGAGRRARPSEMRGLVVALAAEAEVGRKDMGIG